MTLAVLKYQMLGVNFVKGDDLRLRCDFTQIDQTYPDDVFSFVLNVNDDDEYEVEECEPMLNASDVAELVYDLNDDGLWSHFILGMREAFKRTLEWLWNNTYELKKTDIDQLLTFRNTHKRWKW